MGQIVPAGYRVAATSCVSGHVANAAHRRGAACIYSTYCTLYEKLCSLAKQRGGVVLGCRTVMDPSSLLAKIIDREGGNLESFTMILLCCNDRHHNHNNIGNKKSSPASKWTRVGSERQIMPQTNHLFTHNVIERTTLKITEIR